MRLPWCVMMVVEQQEKTVPHMTTFRSLYKQHSLSDLYYETWAKGTHNDSRGCTAPKRKLPSAAFARLNRFVPALTGSGLKNAAPVVAGRAIPSSPEGYVLRSCARVGNSSSISGTLPVFQSAIKS